MEKVKLGSKVEKVEGGSKVGKRSKGRGAGGVEWGEWIGVSGLCAERGGDMCAE